MTAVPSLNNRSEQRRTLITPSTNALPEPEKPSSTSIFSLNKMLHLHDSKKNPNLSASSQAAQSSRRKPTAASYATTTPAPPRYSASSDWLSEATQQRRVHLTDKEGRGSRKNNNVNTDTGGFDGTVAVPKPSRIFGPSSSAAPKAQPLTGRTSRQPASLDNETLKKRILTMQREVATLIKGQQNYKNAQNKDKSKIKTSPRSGQKQLSSSKRSFFDTLDAVDGKFDADRVLAAKSRFANEVEAEEYARSRNRVLTLEKEEESETKTEATSGKAANSRPKEQDSLIQKEWFCRTCKRMHSVDPLLCRRSGHNVKVRRKIRETETKGKQRQALSDRTADDGGLKLGSGLEWSRWKSSR